MSNADSRAHRRPPNGTVRIQLANQEWLMTPGDALTFGRGGDRDIRFGHAPEDDFVSRQAGTLLALSDGVLVRNDSKTQGLVMQAFPGPEQLIGPGMAVGTMPYDHLTLMVPGRHGSRYALLIDVRSLNGDPAVPVTDLELPTRPSNAIPTRATAGKVTPREHRMLTALCEPILTLAGPDAVPATYRQIAERLGGTAASARYCLDQVRLRLTEVDGIPGLRHEEDEIPAEHSDFRPALARWALYSGTVTREHLPLLDDPPADDTS